MDEHLSYFAWVYLNWIKPIVEIFKYFPNFIKFMLYSTIVYGWIGWIIGWVFTVMHFIGEEGWLINGVFVYMNQPDPAELWVASNTGYCFLILIGWIFIGSIVYWYKNVKTKVPKSLKE
jgi:hypothetical protein